MLDEEGRICVICGRVLEQLRQPSTGRIVEYRHAAVDLPADHVPVPVRPDAAPHQVRYRCDFCLGEPLTHTLVVDRELSIPEVGITWDTEWGACAPCSELLLADRWLDLRRRAFAENERRHGTMSDYGKAEMRMVYRDLRKCTLFIYREQA